MRVVGILGKKVGMTQIFVEDGRLIPVTVIEAGPCWVVQTKTAEKDGYEAIQLGFGKTKENRLVKPRLGHLKKSKAGPLRVLREIRVPAASEFEVGQEIKADIFSPGDMVTVTGVSKGKGFAGSIKRHGFSGGKATHGSMFHRAPGSIGAAAWPSRVFKGRKMPGRMGSDRKTLKNLTVMRVDAEKNLLIIKGSLPGANSGMLMISGAGSPKKDSE
jgi:large subunit ribosomal protein L3